MKESSASPAASRGASASTTSRMSRADQAALTRRRVIDSAQKLLLTEGWNGTTIRAVARDAGVSQETVYKGFGGKAALLKAVYDVRIAGDDAPVSIAEREGIARLRAAETPVAAADAWAAHALAILTRSAPIMALALGARATELELAEFIATTDAERMTGATNTAAHWERLGWLRGSPSEARDHIWLLGAPSAYQDVVALGWEREQQHAWYRDTLLALVLVAHT